MSKVTIRVETAPDEFEAPENWVGSVHREGHKHPLMLQAKDWRHGDIVHCPMRVEGELMMMRFKVHHVTRLEET